jgi:hypothetical protein
MSQGTSLPKVTVLGYKRVSKTNISFTVKVGRTKHIVGRTTRFEREALIKAISTNGGFPCELPASEFYFEMLEIKNPVTDEVNAYPRIRIAESTDLDGLIEDAAEVAAEFDSIEKNKSGNSGLNVRDLQSAYARLLRRG